MAQVVEMTSDENNDSDKVDGSYRGNINDETLLYKYN
jgi:hypothetical protein